MDGLTRSICITEIILDDIKTSYAGAGGGGIGEIRQLSTSRYKASLLFEERKDIVTYQFSFSAEDGTPTISEKSVSAETKP